MYEDGQSQVLNITIAAFYNKVEVSALAAAQELLQSQLQRLLLGSGLSFRLLQPVRLRVLVLLGHEEDLLQVAFEVEEQRGQVCPCPAAFVSGGQEVGVDLGEIVRQLHPAMLAVQKPNLVVVVVEGLQDLQDVLGLRSFLMVGSALLCVLGSDERLHLLEDI
jgi:hypothetical protein